MLEEDTLICVQFPGVGVGLTSPVGSGALSNPRLLRKSFQFTRAFPVTAFVHSWFSFFTCYLLLVYSYKLALLKDVMDRYMSVCYYIFTNLVEIYYFFSLSPSSPTFPHSLKSILFFLPFSPLPPHLHLFPLLSVTENPVVFDMPITGFPMFSVDGAWLRICTFWFKGEWCFE